MTVFVTMSTNGKYQQERGKNMRKIVYFCPDAYLLYAIIYAPKILNTFSV